jgi:predicted amidohydrolase YtcJ
MALLDQKLLARICFIPLFKERDDFWFNHSCLLLDIFVSFILFQALRKPYLGTKDKKGLLIYEREVLNKMVFEAHQKGWQLEVHAIGDEAAEVIF